MVVEKAVKMAEMMEVPTLGLVENMSYVACPDCGRKIYLFGQGKTAQAAERHHLPVLAEMPIDPALAALTDAGDIESFQAAAGPGRRQAGGGVKHNGRTVSIHGAAFVPFVRPMQIHRREAPHFVGKNSCKMRQDSR